MTRIHSDPAEIDPAHWAERDTDAGARPAFDHTEPDPDDALERQRDRERAYRSLREMAVAALAVAMLSACGAGLEDPDTRPVCEWTTVANQPLQICKVAE